MQLIVGIFYFTKPSFILLNLGDILHIIIDELIKPWIESDDLLCQRIDILLKVKFGFALHFHNELSKVGDLAIVVLLLLSKVPILTF